MGGLTHIRGHGRRSQWQCGASDSVPHGSGQQGIREVEGGPHLFLDPKGATYQVAAEVCLVVAAVELEHLDDYKDAAYLAGQLECQTGLQSGSHPPCAIDGRRPVVEVHASNWPPPHCQIWHQCGSKGPATSPAMGGACGALGSGRSCGVSPSLQRPAMVEVASGRTQDDWGQVVWASP